VRLARQVTHDNVCRVFDFGFHERGGEQIAYITMELLRGITLRQHLQRSGPFALERARPIVRQMIAALAHAHAAGIVHRDFKSDNVMLVDGGGPAAERVVVTDFGLALLVADSQPVSSNSNGVLGTLDYMSPEQVEGKPATEASDIYSLGVVIFELLTARLPFEAETPLARALRRVTHAPLLLASVRDDIDPGWNEAVARCLERSPVQRFPSLGALSAMLEDRSGAQRLDRSQHPWTGSSNGV
jgi:serine/threonine-protein kinase